ncbi:hypothetical protein E5676_scaffold242G00330 [Cucumis melo var. makuwa]|uniref:Uncharacterized protein n=1 Tax=Cucumis melo var. makuwa TaxID=1194695 RepID=A0A5A7TEM6_CUCMM|nr:hypothetical protein E6C27_scaffold93G00840 [Cucumis melo var. makuwa]TYK19644.1 hypothetical protein E5676_scaffold242G00330 [Cucumis melo var. makuwa]
MKFKRSVSLQLPNVVVGLLCSPFRRVAELSQVVELSLVYFRPVVAVSPLPSTPKPSPPDLFRLKAVVGHLLSITVHRSPSQDKLLFAQVAVEAQPHQSLPYPKSGTRPAPPAVPQASSCPREPASAVPTLESISRASTSRLLEPPSIIEPPSFLVSHKPVLGPFSPVLDCVIQRDRQFGIDIDMIRVIRRDRSQPNCLSVSSGYTTDQFVLCVPLGSPKTSYVPPRSHVACVSSWVPLFRTLIGKAEVRAKASCRATRSDRGEP